MVENDCEKKKSDELFLWHSICFNEQAKDFY